MKSPLCLLPGLAATAAAAMLPYQNPAQPLDVRVRDLLGRMTLEEKVAQLQPAMLLQPQSFNAADEFTPGTEAGALANGAGSVWTKEDYRFLPDLRRQVLRQNSLQKYLREKTRLGIPAFAFGEALHGYMEYGATSFPQAIALGCTWDTALVEQVFQVAGREAALRGVRQVLSPVLDLAREPRWGRFEECYGEDPYLVAQIGLAAIRGLQGRGPGIGAQQVAVTLKHFAGHGQPEGGRNMAPVNLSEREFRSGPLLPFEVAIRQGGAQSVMASYNEWDGVPNHLNHRLLTGILRGEWGFTGMVMGDGSGMDMVWEHHRVAATTAEVGRLCLAAGLDHDLGGQERCFSTIGEQVRAGLVPAADLDRAVAAVLRMKFVSGLFDRPFADPEEAVRQTNTAESRALARRAATAAMILLKNDGPVLPLDPTRLRTLAVIGPNAADLHLGGYSAVPMAGRSVLAGLQEFAAGTGLKIVYAEGCRLTASTGRGWLVSENPLPPDPAVDARLLEEAVATARTADAVILVLGESELLRREAWADDHLGDRDTLALPGRQMELARSLLATGKPVVVLLFNGGPLAIPELAAQAPAILECWYLGQETGPAVADVLFGRVSPSGKLTVTLPRSVGQIPCYYNHKPSRFRAYNQADSTPLYPFGHGLSYTTFAYRHLEVAPAVIPPNGTARVSVEVTNTGTRPADEIVQLYIHAVSSLPTRPVQELQDFTRVPLAPGETRRVSFDLTPDKLAAWDLAMQRTVSPGDYEIMVGTSSQNYLTCVLRVE